MQLEEKVKKTRIIFPQAISSEETEELFDYIAKKLPAHISYNMNYSKAIIYQGKGSLWKHVNSIDMEGNIKTLDRKTDVLFDIIQPTGEYTKTIHLAFRSLVIDRELTEEKPETQQLWDKVRETVKQYFEEKFPDAHKPEQELTPAECIPFREDPVKIKEGYKITTMHIGATHDKTEDLKEIIERQYTTKPNIEKEEEEDETITYSFKGEIKGIKHICEVQVIGMIPFSCTHIHHADVSVPKDKQDSLSPIIKKEFLKYEEEYNTYKREAEKIMKKEMKKKT